MSMMGLSAFSLSKDLFFNIFLVMDNFRGACNVSFRSRFKRFFFIAPPPPPRKLLVTPSTQKALITYPSEPDKGIVNVSVFLGTGLYKLQHTMVISKVLSLSIGHFSLVLQVLLIAYNTTVHYIFKAQSAWYRVTTVRHVFKAQLAWSRVTNTLSCRT